MAAQFRSQLLQLAQTCGTHKEVLDKYKAILDGILQVFYEDFGVMTIEHEWLFKKPLKTILSLASKNLSMG
jgi:hypothetical protein